MGHASKILEEKTREANIEMSIKTDIMNLEIALYRLIGIIDQKELTPFIHEKYNLH
jgi:hypothetical protein